MKPEDDKKMLQKKYHVRKLAGTPLNKQEASDDDEDDESSNSGLTYFQSINKQRVVRAYLDEGIKEAKYYRNWIQVVESLSQHDVVYLSINNYGGYLDGAIALINAMETTEAHVHVCIDGVAASAASLVALAAPSVSVSPYASMMIHAATFGAFGKQSDVIGHATFVDKQVKDLMHQVYADFLSDEEFEEVMLGREIWLNSDEIIERLMKRAEIRKEREMQEQKLPLEEQAKTAKQQEVKTAKRKARAKTKVPAKSTVAPDEKKASYIPPALNQE